MGHTHHPDGGHSSGGGGVGGAAGSHGDISALAARALAAAGPVPPPDPRSAVKTFVIDLDAAPEKRWTEAVRAHRLAILALMDVIRPVFRAHAARATDELVAAASSHAVPAELMAEMRGIAAELGVRVRDVLEANLFYEITSVADTPLSRAEGRSCTSVVAQRSNGTVYLARNQDYPTPFKLVMIHAVFVRGGAVAYEGTTYAGTVGLSTALARRGQGGSSAQWAVSINARDNPLKGTARAIDEAVANANRGGALFPLFTRQACEAAAAASSSSPASLGAAGGYKAALDFFATRPLIVPGYVIVAGSAPGSGAVVTRNGSAVAGQRGAADVFALFSERPPSRDPSGGGTWFVVQTNTDHQRKAPAYPGFNVSRREEAVRGLERVGEGAVALEALWGVLSTPPTFNEDTIHTDLVAPAWGEYRTFRRGGP